jgi:hypothetical protein
MAADGIVVDDEAAKGLTRLTGIAGRAVGGVVRGVGAGEVGLAGVGTVRLGEALGDEGGALGTGRELATQAKLPPPRPPLPPSPPSARPVLRALSALRS